MKIAIIVAALIINGCSTSVPIQKTFSEKTVNITWIRSSARCNGAIACSTFKEGGKSECTIYVTDITDLADVGGQEILGHEILHCFYGKVHD
jgi:hypothetical protein